MRKSGLGHVGRHASHFIHDFGELFIGGIIDPDKMCFAGQTAQIE